jgi:hypothetical protein
MGKPARNRATSSGVAALADRTAAKRIAIKCREDIRRYYRDSDARKSQISVARALPRKGDIHVALSRQVALPNRKELLTGLRAYLSSHWQSDRLKTDLQIHQKLFDGTKNDSALHQGRPVIAQKYSAITQMDSAITKKHSAMPDKLSDGKN